MRRVICVVLALALIVALPVRSHAAPNDYQSKSVLLMEASTGTILIEQNIDQTQPIASITKIMSLILIMEAIERDEMSLEDEVIVSKNAQGMGGSQVYLDANYPYSVGDLIKSIVVASANDACVAMAETLAGDEENFVTRMNAKAATLGMTNTVFMNCTGLPVEGAYSTARDVAIMSRELITHPLFFQYSSIWTDTLPHQKDGRVTDLANTNKLVRWYVGADGIKTGSTDGAGACLSATALRNGTRYIAVVLGASTGALRFSEAEKLLDFGFNAYMLVDPLEGETEMTLEIANGNQKMITVAPQGIYKQLLTKGASTEFDVQLVYPQLMSAPIQIGDTVATLVISYGGKEVARVPLVATEDVDSATLLNLIEKILKGWA